MCFFYVLLGTLEGSPLLLLFTIFRVASDLLILDKTLLSPTVIAKPLSSIRSNIVSIIILLGIIKNVLIPVAYDNNIG